MIAKKTKKTNSKATAKTNGYNLNNIATKKAVQPVRKNGALHGFFSLMGVVIAIGSLMALIVPLVAYAKQGTFIVEPFSCEVTLADYAELQRRLEVTARTDWKYPIFLVEYEATVNVLAEHIECEVK